MTNSNPVAKCGDLLEQSVEEESNLENAQLDSLSNTDGIINKGNGCSSGNNTKEICWFYMNHNYCRYGRSCKYSHERSDISEFLGNRNPGPRKHKPAEARNFPRTGNLKQTMNSKSSSHHKNEHEVQNRQEKGDSYARQCISTSNKDKYSDQHSDSPENLCNDTSVDKHPIQSNVQMSHQSNLMRRQRNLYFYRSNKSASSGVTTRDPNVCRYFSRGFCRQGDRCKFLHQGNDVCDTVEKTDAKPKEELGASGNEKGAVETCNKPQLQKYFGAPTSGRHIKLQGMDQDDIQRLRDTEIRQLKKRFPNHELIESCPEEIFHVMFFPSDPDWPFAVNSVSLEVAFSMEYPREACAIKVLEADNLPQILVRHLNNSIGNWIKEKHDSSLASGRAELLFRPFLRWIDRNLEKLFIVGLRKVKQDMLAKEAGIEFVPYDELPGSTSEVSAATQVVGTAKYTGEGSWQTSSQESGGNDLTENPERSSESNNIKHVQHVNDKENLDYDTARERDKCVISEIEADYSSTGAEKENFSLDLLSVKLTPRKEKDTLLIPTNLNCDEFNIPKLGTEVKLSGLELKENAAAAVCTKIAVTLQCSRCKTRHEINTPAKRNNSLNCIKCHHLMQIVYQPAILHQFSAILGYLHLIDCQAVDLPLMECNFSVDCLNCSKQMSIDGIHYGQQRITWCMYCNKKISIYTQSVKFHQLQPAPNIATTGHRIITETRREKKILKDPAIQEGKPLPDCGTCKHYKKSYRWLRFPCCGKAYPCDVCHDEKETDHEMKYASRVICGFCANEQPYAGSRPCVSCSSNMTKKSGAHWEGGKGCRDKITMSREDHQKYSGMGKTISRKAQSQNSSKK